MLTSHLRNNGEVVEQKKQPLSKDGFKYSYLGITVVEVTYPNLAEVHWLHEGGRSCEHAGVQDTSGGWDDLATTTMDGVGVKGNILDVEPYRSHILITHNTLQHINKFQNMFKMLVLTH